MTETLDLQWIMARARELLSACVHALDDDDWHIKVDVTFRPPEGGGITFTVGTREEDEA